jgi:hypothetical protein
MDQFNHIAFSELFQEFVSMYLREYGEKKAKDIADKVNDSDKCRKFLIQANNFKGQVGTDDFVATILSSTSFSFSKAETVCLATILLLFRWQLEIGTPNGIADEVYLNKIFFRIIDKCDKYKTHVSTSQNFFEKFYSHLKNTILNFEIRY